MPEPVTAATDAGDVHPNPQVIDELRTFGRATHVVLVCSQISVVLAAFLSNSTAVLVAVFLVWMLALELVQRRLRRAASREARALLLIKPRKQRLGWRGVLLWAAYVSVALALLEWKFFDAGHDVFFPMVFFATFMGVGFGTAVEFARIRDLSLGRLVAVDGPEPLYRQSSALPEALAVQALRAAQDAPAWRMLHGMLALSVAWDPLESTCRHASLSIL